MREPLLGVRVPERDQAIRFRIRERPQHHGIDDGEYRGRGAGAQAEHEDGDNCKRRMLAKLPHRQSNRTPHVQAPSAGGSRHYIGARRLRTIGMLRGVASKQGKRRLLERRQRAPARIARGGTLVDGRGVKVLEIGDELVDRRLRQFNAGLRDVTTDFGAEIDRAHAGFTPATCDSAVMKRPQSARWVASMARPLSVMR